MKTQDFQRGITSRQERESAEGPNLGRLARMRDSDSSNAKAPSRRRGSRADATRKKAALIWSAVLSLVALVLIGLAVAFWLMPHLSRESTGIAGVQFNRDVRVASKFPSPSREKALELVKRALANRDPDQLESVFRMGTANRAEVLAFLQASEQRDGIAEGLEWLSSMDINGLLLDGVLVRYKNKDKRVDRLAFLTPDAAGTWKLDFDAFARTVTPSWQELLENGAEQALVRVFVGPDFYYNGPFGDDKRWDCYGFTSPETELVMRGYCEKGSDVAAAMSRLFYDGRKLIRATLEIRRVKDGGALQFEITRLVAEDWVVADPSADKS